MRRDPRVCVVVYPELPRRIMGGDGEGARLFERHLDSPGRLILEVTPEQWITYDGHKMVQLDEQTGAPPPQPRSAATQRRSPCSKRARASSQ